MTLTNKMLAQIDFPDKQSLMIPVYANPEEAVLKTFWAAIEMGVDVYYAAVAGLVTATRCNNIVFCMLMGCKTEIKVMAIWRKTQFVDTFSYDLKNTPCEQVEDSDKIIGFEDVKQKFPLDPYLMKEDGPNYVGLSLRDIQNRVLGHIYLIDDLPLEQLMQFENTLGIVLEAVKLEL